MAAAAGHKFGKFIGEYCETALEPLLLLELPLSHIESVLNWNL
jgi:hypothetical protein